MKRRPLIDRLVDAGLCEDRKQAAALVMAGLVLINGQPAFAGQMIRSADVIRVKRQGLPYASKGGLKLEGALAAFGVDPTGCVCLDAGASTGGFTDCLLQHGARLVYAVDVGYGQLTGELRQDKRVINLERTNLAAPKLRSLSPTPQLATCDLSYLSLLDAVPLYRAIMGAQGSLLALVKPLFEIEDATARREGHIGESAYAPMLYRLAERLNQQGRTQVINVCASPITGNAGTLEFFFYLEFGPVSDAIDLKQAIDRSVDIALRIQPYKKAGDLTIG